LLSGGNFFNAFVVANFGLFFWLLLQHVFRSELASTTKWCSLKTRTKRRNWAELTQISFWQTVQWASSPSPLLTGWRVCARSHVLTDAVRRCLF